MNVRSSNDVSCYPAPSEVDSNHGNPCSLVGNSLFPKSGNTPGRAPKSDQITEAASPGSPDFGVFPCIFPANQGFAPRDEFARDCPHRHSVCRCGDFPRALGHSLRNPRDSAGSWSPSPRVSEPETSDSGPGRHRIPRLSLLPSWAVRFRFRFAPAKGGAQQSNTASSNPTRSAILSAFSEISQPEHEVPGEFPRFRRFFLGRGTPWRTRTGDRRVSAPIAPRRRVVSGAGYRGSG